MGQPIITILVNPTIGIAINPNNYNKIFQNTFLKIILFCLHEIIGIVPSLDRMTTLESFRPRTEGIPRSRSIPGQIDSPGVVPSQDKKTHLESFYPRTE